MERKNPKGRKGGNYWGVDEQRPRERREQSHKPKSGQKRRRGREKFR